MNMATDCCCTPSIAEVLCIHLLAYDEMRLYQTCKTIHAHHHERREWWQHVKQFGGLAFHTTPGMGQRSWNCFTVWRDCVFRDTLPEFPDEAALVNYQSPEGSASATPSSHSSPSESSGADPDPFLPIIDLAWDSPQLAGSGPKGGPLCEHCGKLACVGRSETKGLICARCLQGECIDQVISYWGNLHRNHSILSQPTLARHILEYMYGNGLAAYCYCGQCNPDWFLHGWVCCPYSGARVMVRPDRNNLAWRRSTRTPWWEIEESM